MSLEVIHMQILAIGVLMLAAYLCGRLTRLIKVGEMVGQVLGGLIAGPVVLWLLEHKLEGYHHALESMHFFMFLFLSVVVFGIGDELSFGRFTGERRNTVIICLVQAVATWVLVSASFLLLGFKPTIAFLIGSIGIATAPAATFVIMNKLGISGNMRRTLGGILILDDVIEVIVFSITMQVALFATRGTGVEWGPIMIHLTREMGLAVLVGVGIFGLICLLVERGWLRQEVGPERGPMLGHEFLSRLISELPGPSMQTFVIISSCVAVGVGLALQWHLPFLITAITAGVLVSQLYSKQVFHSLRIENATSMYTLVFFALIGANADLSSFHPENFLPVAVYVVARAAGKIGGTWLGCKIVHEEKRLASCLPRLMLPQAGVAAVEAFFAATVLGVDGQTIVGIILPGLIVFEIVGVIVSEHTLRRWHSWMTGGGDLIEDEQAVRNAVVGERLQLRDMLYPECLHVPLKAGSKGEAIWQLITTLQTVGAVHEPGEVLDKILERERQGGTTVGDGIAILHGRLDYLERPAVALGVLPPEHSLTFDDSQDGEINIVYLVLSPSSRPEQHLQVLASIARFLSKGETRTLLRKARDETEAMEVIAGHAEHG